LPIDEACVVSDSERPKHREHASRRAFIKSSLLAAGSAVGGPLNLAASATPLQNSTIRIGLIGCGKRGAAAAIEALQTTGGDVQLVALADVFADRLQATFRCLRGRCGNQVRLPREHRFVGLDAYLGVMQTDVDVVLLATPPAFRPLHFAAAVRAGKHVFMERPLAVDAQGVHRVWATNREAVQRQLAVAVGFQRRHEPAVHETIDKLREGAIGEIVWMRVYSNANQVPLRSTPSGKSQLEEQLRNWRRVPWLGGDQLVEQGVQNLDLMNWIKDAAPVEAQGQSGRISSDASSESVARDYRFLEYTYADGSRLFSQSRRAANCWNVMAAHAHGTHGRADVTGCKIYDAAGRLTWRSESARGGHQRHQQQFFAAVRSGAPFNEVECGTRATFTAILGRVASQAGRSVTWDDALANVESLGEMS
jgi:predicted dehydrogenase